MLVLTVLSPSARWSPTRGPERRLRASCPAARSATARCSPRAGAWLYFGLREAGSWRSRRRSGGRGRAISLGRRRHDHGVTDARPAVARPHDVAAGQETMRMALREVDAGGRVVARMSHVLPRWGKLVAVVDGGLLISRGSRARAAPAATPATPHPRRLAARRRRLALRVVPGGGCRRLGVWSSEEGDRVLEPPAGLRPDDRGTGRPSRRTGRAWRSPSQDAGRLARRRDRRRARRAGASSRGGRIDGYRATAWSPVGPLALLHRPAATGCWRRAAAASGRSGSRSGPAAP